VYAWQTVPDEMWKEGYDTITEYARSEGCKKLEFYTSNPIVVNLARKYGFLTEYTYGVLDLS
jgi:hypothetical protein